MSRYNEILQKVKWNALQNYLNDGITITDTKEVAAKLYAEECVKASLEKASENLKMTDLNSESKTAISECWVVDKESVTNPENIILL